ncbi:MAG TPA: hypothetical protein DEB39_09870 [Planctomycetaceae bacterium]|nr:hypothetical protein [Planctomycetaceae bacterium]
MLSLHPVFTNLLQEDRRYPLAAYTFVFESLEYAQKALNFGVECETEPLSTDMKLSQAELDELREREQKEGLRKNHVTGQDLCEAARQFAMAQYGLLARSVLESIGIRSTGDIGNIVYNLMTIGHMRKTPQDRREDFDDVFDFATAFEGQYVIGEEIAQA